MERQNSKTEQDLQKVYKDVKVQEEEDDLSVDINMDQIQI